MLPLPWIWICLAVLGVWLLPAALLALRLGRFMGRTNPMSEMVERVARAICDSADADQSTECTCRPATCLARGPNRVARAGIEAMREPSRAMWAAGGTAIVGKTAVHHDTVLTLAWQAMIDAALRD